jgi:sugar O-acyltransferase (sialic acid O-acetyltransferase NeuD family)
MDAIVIVGASGHGKVVADIVEQAGQARIAGFLDRDKPAGSEFFGLPVLGTEAELPRLVRELNLAGMLVAIGDNWSRARVAGELARLAPGLPFAAAVHPAARLARGAEVGPGTVVMAGAVLNSDCRVGAHCIVNTGASLDHDGMMGDFSSLAPGAALGGNVRVGAYSAVSIGACVAHGLKVGEHAVVGAGAVVLSDVPDLCVAYGSPARKIRDRQPGERYL